MNRTPLPASSSYIPVTADGSVDFRKGLEGVTVAETLLSYPDSAGRRLIIRGRDVIDLATTMNFEGASAFLWRDLVSGGANEISLGEARLKAFAILSQGNELIKGLAPTDAVRTMISAFPDNEPHTARPLEVLAALAVAAAMSLRLAKGERPVPPDAGLSHAADVLRMIHGRKAPETAVAALDLYLVTMLEHGLNASTFTARVVASTGAGIVASITAALAAFRGPLHGGAPSLVLDMLDEITSPEEAEAFVQRCLAERRKVFGFGSRGYVGRDPRTDLFKRTLFNLFGKTRRLLVAEAVEAAILDQFRRLKPGRSIETNVEYYGSLLLEAAGVPRSGFTSLFAASRCAGWIAHIREEEQVGRLMRPAARYLGPMPKSVA